MVNRSSGSDRRSPAISRGVSILDELAGRRSLSLAELASRVSLAKSSVFDVCSALVEAGLIQRSSDSSYGLGPRVMTLAGGFSPAAAVVEGFASYPLDDTALDGHTLSIASMQGAEILTLNVRLGRHPLSLTPRPGARSVLTSTVAGVTILRALPMEAVADELDSFGPHQGLSPEHRERILQLARGHEGRACDDAQNQGHSHCAAYVDLPHHHSLTAVVLHLPVSRDRFVDVGELEAGLSAFTASLTAQHSPP